ncbi:unnamed protein product [Candida verbasci]|uniref:tRNA-splicing endonuclease subunit Sen34 n=1 Tax=Candida verbasci TaxID=1227364 RepID=A0A9W4TU86_9ASCO|nr:unnamed protein product [Candida verbasci]
MTTTNKVILPVINIDNDPEVLIFDLEVIKYLRIGLNVLGVLTGTLSTFPQQNLFLSVPLKLIIWEVIWLTENNKGILVDAKSYRNDKLKIGSVSKSKTTNNMVIIPSTDNNRNEELITKNQIDIKTFITKYLQNSNYTISKFINNYKYYKHLQNSGYFINPGIKFGGDLVIYPGDPLRYHSYSTIKFNFCDIDEIIVGGRLATSVKKNMILIGYEDENENDKRIDEIDDDVINDLYRNDKEPLTFSIEWSGFG